MKKCFSSARLFASVALVLSTSVAAAQPSQPRLDRNELLIYRDDRGQVQPVRSPADWQKRRASVLAGMQQVMGPLPGKERRCALDVEVQEEVDCGSYVRRLLTYASEPDSRVPAYLLIPKRALEGKETAPAVLCLHPTDDRIGHKVVVGLGGNPNRQYAQELAERGYVALAPSYPLLANYQPDLKKLGYQSGTMKAIWDNVRGIDLLESLPYVKPGGAGAIGHSLGGHNAVYTAVFDERIKAIVTSCGLDSYLDYMDGDIRGWTSTRYMPKLLDYKDRLEEIPFDFHELVGSLAPRHCLISAPLGDSNFKWESVDRIAKAARPVYALYGVPERLRVEHPDCDHDFPDPMRQAAYQLFDAVLHGPAAAQTEPALTPLLRVVDLSVGELQPVELSDGATATVKLLDLQEQCDDVRGAVRAARLSLEVNGQQVELVAAPYELPKTLAGVQIDCSVTKGYNSNGRPRTWGLDKDVRLRLWPEGSPLLQRGTFVYPVKQRWFASDTQMANEPVHVDDVERPSQTSNIYYHDGLDIGGAEGMVEVVAATDGLVVSSGLNVLDAHKQDTPVEPRYDVVYVLDARGWYYRYSHLKEIDATIVPGRRVKMGGRVGVLGKEGGSGGWSHLHFDIKSRQPSGKWGTQEGYAFLWDAYRQQHKPKLIAVARPHQLIWSGDAAVLDATKSWSERGRIVQYQWLFDDGGTASGPRVQRTYSKPGRYSEVLKITDADGNLDYDFAVVQVIDREHPDRLSPSIHATYAPTFGIRPGDLVTVKVRTFGTTHGTEVWDFGDGSPKVEVRSDGNVDIHAEDGYAVTTHRFQQPGHYVARVERGNADGFRAVGHVHVHVEGD
ncbi:MAG: PKD domain-containing protein [Planctomycetes bacterium]|nr:PKD domain-containing protein [Planctomycetota bacterium]